MPWSCNPKGQPANRKCFIARQRVSNSKWKSILFDHFYRNWTNIFAQKMLFKGGFSVQGPGLAFLAFVADQRPAGCGSKQRLVIPRALAGSWDMKEAKCVGSILWGEIPLDLSLAWVLGRLFFKAAFHAAVNSKRNLKTSPKKSSIQKRPDWIVKPWPCCKAALAVKNVLAVARSLSSISRN